MSTHPSSTANRLAQIGAQPPFELLEAGSRRVALTRRGSGRPVLCLHAIAHGARDFAPLADRLSDRCEIIAIDFPGHGRSPHDGKPIRVARYGEIVSAVVEALGLERPILLGNSIGGGAAIVAAARAPESFSGLVLCDSAGLIAPSPLATTVIQRLVETFRSGVAGEADFAAAFAAYYRDTVLPEDAAAPQRERIIAAAYELAPLLLDAWTGFMEPESFLGEIVPEVTIPVWCAWSRNDPLLAWDYCKPVAETFPDFSVDFFEGGHSAFLEDPDAFAEGLTRFLDRTE